MERAFSKVLSASEGRYLTPIEREDLLRASLELSHRMTVSAWIHESEYAIIDYATQAFCDTVSSFEAPVGSMRRKKGHQDGRIILRYIAQSVREGSTEILFEKVLSWLVGHLDSGNVTGHHMEVFFHFIQQGCRRELPRSAHAFVDVAFEQIIDCVRQASASATIHKAHRRIAEFAANRVMEILPEVKAKYGVSSLPKCKRDIELLVKEIARVMRSPDRASMMQSLSGWMIERLVSQVAYDSEVWYWTLLAVREGIVDCCGPDSVEMIDGAFEAFCSRAQHLLEAVEWSKHAGEIADDVAAKLIERGEPLGLLRSDEFQTAVSMVNRQLIQEIASLHAYQAPQASATEIAAVWTRVVLPLMPSQETPLLAGNLKLLAEIVQERVGGGSASAFRGWLEAIVECAKRTEVANRVALVADRIAVETADWAIDNLSSFTADRRGAYRDLRLVMAKIVTLIPNAVTGDKAYELRRYATRFLLPNLPFPWQTLQQVYERAIRITEESLHADDARIVRGYIEELLPCMERYSRLGGIVSSMDKLVSYAVDRGYHAAPNHESLQRHGQVAGRRDGAFLIERMVDAAVIGGDVALSQLHRSFYLEQVRLSKLPGRVIVEFLRGMMENLRDYPEVTEILLGLSAAAPLYSSSIRIRGKSSEWASRLTEMTLSQSASYREQIGPAGAEACARDNAVTLRGIAGFMVQSPMDSSVFGEWWASRIAKNIRSRPEGFDSSTRNFENMLLLFREQLDKDEADATVAYLQHGVKQLTNGPHRRANVDTKKTRVPMPVLPMSFADVVSPVV